MSASIVNYMGPKHKVLKQFEKWVHSHPDYDIVQVQWSHDTYGKESVLELEFLVMPAVRLK